VGNKIAYYRNKKSMTQDKLAKITGISRPYLSDIENDKKKPSCLIALKISKVLNEPVEDIFFGIDVNLGLQNGI